MVRAVLKSVVRFFARIRRYARLFGYARLLCLLLLIAMLGVRVADPIPLEELRVRTFDGYQILKPRETTQRPVVIIDIDEKSLAKFGQWPWPRTRVADLVQRLTDLGAAAIAFDIVFAEQDRLSPAIAADAFRDLDEESKAKLRALPSNDQVLADVLRKSPSILGESGLPKFVPQPELKLPLTGLATLGGDPRPFLLQFPGLLRNVPVLEEAAPGRGLFTIRTERDGIVRRVPMIMLAQGELMPSLTFEMLRIVTKSDTILVKSDEAGVKSVAVPGFEVPTDRNGQLWVHFAKHDAARYVSAADVLDGKVGPDRISRKLILIGTSAVGLLDVKTTPLDPVMPGVEVHAQVLESALTRSVLSQPNYAVGAELLAAILFGIAIIWLAPILSAIMLLLFGAVIVSIMVATSWYFFAEHRLLLDFTFPLIASTAIYLVLVFSSYFREQAQRRRIRSAFGQYLSPALVEQLAQSPEKLVLGGEERDMTIMFSDVRGFTTISESFKSDPQGLTSLMNRFLTPLTNAILDRKGTIDKYMGDAIMAFWNAPLSDQEHQVNACNAALDMIDRIEALNVEREREANEAGKPFIPMKVGIGLNTGTCVVGNMGSNLRFDYSVLGDSVNLASRLEGQSKSYGVPIIAGSATALAAKDKFAIIEIDFITVKGKKEPEVIYAIVGREDVAKSGPFQRLRNLSIEMLACYRSRDWDGALAAIAKGRIADEAKSFSAFYDLYSERIDAFRKTPPPEDWNGVIALTTK
ncbi:CHASE2 domain-containing protein [Afipia birgiae]|jgi:adenylate cyclase|uniref:CHASE2 domain-containing protein n=1 Tax=Afipia birgiae TaxID=151414 RepID=UPI000376C5A7|nr:adenylate/guanylate cyclase domain-containing protein [Afipia birgiae]MBX9821933.1 adenylate/guanylate cyclase domain-containing protein [Afipia birgiae]